MTIHVKICGICDLQALHAVTEGGATAIGFVLFSPSKNAIAPAEAYELAKLVPAKTLKFGLVVDPTDDELSIVLDEMPLDYLQLHGAETPERVAAIRVKANLPVMKALRITGPNSFARLDDYEKVADRILFDSRIGNESSGGPLPWALLKGRRFTKPWILAGGLTAQNLPQAVTQSGATFVDVSSGVDDPVTGRKSPGRIREFLQVASAL